MLLKTLQDVAQVAAHVLTGKGKHGFDDRHRGQMMVVTGRYLDLFSSNQIANIR
jgi:hypothetical protein